MHWNMAETKGYATFDWYSWYSETMEKKNVLLKLFFPL